MASELNDRIQAVTSTGPVNLYSDECFGTASDKALAAAMGGHKYNFLNFGREKYFPNLRTNGHYVDEQGQATGHWWARRRHLSLPPTGESAAECLTSENTVGATEKRKEEQRLLRVAAQIAHLGNFGGFQRAVGGNVSSRRSRSTVENRSWQGKLLGLSGAGHASVERVPLTDGFVTRNNNHFSAICKLTRHDQFFTRPRLGANVPSVTYNTITNQPNTFTY